MQVISLGAGFDSSFFRLMSENFNECHFVEIDLPDVVNRKRQLIQQHSKCAELASDLKLYTLLAGDLRDLAALNTLLIEDFPKQPQHSSSRNVQLLTCIPKGS